jgi:hypothetical protein
MTPTQEIVTTSSQVYEFTDSRGRALKMKPLSVLGQTRLLRAAGPSQSSNEAYLSIIQVAASIIEIDGVVMPFPTGETQIDAMVDRVGDEGYLAVQAFIEKRKAEMKATIEAAQAGSEDPLAPAAS